MVFFLKISSSRYCVLVIDYNWFCLSLFLVIVPNVDCPLWIASFVFLSQLFDLSNAFFFINFFYPDDLQISKFLLENVRKSIFCSIDLYICVCVCVIETLSTAPVTIVSRKYCPIWHIVNHVYAQI